MNQAHSHPVIIALRHSGVSQAPTNCQTKKHGICAKKTYEFDESGTQSSSHHSTQAFRRITGTNQLSNQKTRHLYKKNLCLFVGFLLIEFAVLLSGGILVLLVLGHEIVHVGLGLGELHLIHTLTSVPVQESLSPEHSGKLFTDSLE